MYSLSAMHENIPLLNLQPVYLGHWNPLSQRHRGPQGAPELCVSSKKRPRLTRRRGEAEVEKGMRSSPENRAVITAWIRSKSLFSSPNNSRSRVLRTLFDSATFWSFKPFSSSSVRPTHYQKHCWTQSR